MKMRAEPVKASLEKKIINLYMVKPQFHQHIMNGINNPTTLAVFAAQL